MSLVWPASTGIELLSLETKPSVKVVWKLAGPWADSARLLPTLFDSALQGYPTPPGGPRKVVIELPGEQPVKD